MTILRTIYASGDITEVIISTIEIRISGLEPIRICQGYEDHWLGVDGVPQLFEAGSISLSLPAVDTSGQQTLNFGVGNVNGLAQKYVDHALETDDIVLLIYREYLASDKSEPAKRPYMMVVKGGRFEGVEAQFQASYYDMLNTAWPRERYNADNAPGAKYL